MKLHRALVTREGLSMVFVGLAAVLFCATVWVSVIAVPAARWCAGGVAVCLLLFALLDPGRESGTPEIGHHPPSSAFGVSDSLSDREHGQQHAAGEPKDEAHAAEPLAGPHKDNDESPAASSHRAGVSVLDCPRCRWILSRWRP